jgi:hypothetical protein
MTTIQERLIDGVESFIKFHLRQEVSIGYDFSVSRVQDGEDSVDEWVLNWSRETFAKNIALNGVEVQFIDHDLFDNVEALEYMLKYIREQDNIDVPEDYKLDTFDQVLDMYCLCYTNDVFFRYLNEDIVRPILRRDMAEKYMEIGSIIRKDMFQELELDCNLKYHQFCEFWEEEEEFDEFQTWLPDARIIYKYYELSQASSYVLK